MKILHIFPRFPWPLKDGGAVAFYASLNGFKQKGCDITAAVLNTSKHKIDFQQLPEQIKSLAAFHLFEIDNTINAKGAVKNLFENKSYIISRFYHQGFEKLLTHIVQEQHFDAIIFESLQVASYINCIKLITDAPCLYRAHNIEHQIWLSQAKVAHGFFKKHYLNLQAKRLAKFEKNILHKFDALLPITEADKNTFTLLGFTGPMHVMPVGIDLNKFKDFTPSASGPVFHIGSMDWMPNQEAVTWFLKQVWPQVMKQLPEARFMVAGRNMPANFVAIRQDGVTIAGEVNNAYDFMQQQGIMVVPLFSGSGMRVKVIEGMAMGKCIVATTMGMEGVHAEAGKHYLPANNAQEFIDTLIHLYANKEKALQIGINAKRFVFDKYNNAAIIQNVLDFIPQLKSLKHSDT